MNPIQYRVVEEPSLNPELSGLFDPLMKLVQERYDYWSTRSLCKTSKTLIGLRNTLQFMQLWVDRDEWRNFSRLHTDRICPEALKQAFFRDKKNWRRSCRHYKRLMKELANWLKMKTEI